MAYPKQPWRYFLYRREGPRLFGGAEGSRQTNDSMVRLRSNDTGWATVLNTDHLLVRQSEIYFQVFIHEDLVDASPNP